MLVYDQSSVVTTLNVATDLAFWSDFEYPFSPREWKSFYVNVPAKWHTTEALVKMFNRVVDGPGRDLCDASEGRVMGTARSFIRRVLGITKHATSLRLHAPAAGISLMGCGDSGDRAQAPEGSEVVTVIWNQLIPPRVRIRRSPRGHRCVGVCGRRSPGPRIARAASGVLDRHASGQGTGWGAYPNRGLYCPARRGRYPPQRIPPSAVLRRLHSRTATIAQPSRACDHGGARPCRGAVESAVWLTGILPAQRISSELAVADYSMRPDRVEPF